MSEWNVCSIDELGSVNRGKSKHRPRNDVILFGGLYPFIQTSDVKNANLYISEYDTTYSEIGLAQSKLWKKGTLCITIAANIAESAILGIDACFPDSVVGFMPYEGKADLKFVKYMLDEFKVYMQQISKGTTQDNLSLEKLRRIKFYVPSYETQQKIANILSRYDEAIENNNKRIKLLEQMAQNLYKEWFVRFRFPGWENAEFENGIPKGWNVCRLKDFGKIITGKTPPTEQEEYYGEDVMFVKTPDMHGNIFVQSTSEYLSKLGCEYQKSQYIPENSIMVSCIGTGGITSINAYPANTNQQINSIILDDKNNLPWLYFTVSNMKETIKMFGNTGTTMTNLSKGKFEKLKVLKPYDELIQEFSNKVNPIFEKIKLLNTQITNLTKQRDLLLPRLMSGKLEVNTKGEI